MAFTMHSHSGEFCPGHAADTLEAIILRAIALGFKTIGLTEHMPRTHIDDLYPEEITPTTPPSTALSLFPPRHALYLTTATALRQKYAPHIHILIAFESECPRPSYLPYTLHLASDPRIDYFIGSLHHVRSIPIDFDAATYHRARAACGGTEEGLWTEYFRELRALVAETRPRVVGHVDLVRLYSEEEGRDEWIRMGGRFTFSDDSHGVAQVGTNYLRGLDYLEGLGVTELWTLERVGGGDGDGVKAELRERSVTIAEFRASLKLD
ncbi:putative histidinol-phosphatase [Podospora conica]|nr:putative histidinol-phosphatase [Schizothecium conicum]